jgi:hypothetical protein
MAVIIRLARVNQAFSGTVCCFPEYAQLDDRNIAPWPWTFDLDSAIALFFFPLRAAFGAIHLRN